MLSSRNFSKKAIRQTLKKSINKAAPPSGPSTKPWLGHQEALYSGLRWHLIVPHHNYISQFNPPNKIVFPGEARVNVSGVTNEAKIDLEGFVGAWATDIELAVNQRPKLYGFDFSRATEIWDDGNGIIKTIPEFPPCQRNDVSVFLSGEREMMKDLISSTLHQAGEVCISYHMFNPFLAQEFGPVDETNLGNYFSFDDRDTNILQSLANIDMATHPTSSNYLKVRFNHLGKMLDEILDNSAIPANCNIHIRPFHEPNIGFFWWGQPKNGGQIQAATPTFLNNFYKLWKFALDEITSELTNGTQTIVQKRTRLKFVFSLNAEDTGSVALGNSLDDYLPSNALSQAANAPARIFAESIDVLGLDYYQDDGPTPNTLSAQYQVLSNRAGLLGMEHALTEVGMRTGFNGKMYGEHGGNNPWLGQAKNFFSGTVASVATQYDPKWVMFWANRLGNSAFTRLAPTTSPTTGPAGFQSDLFYGDAKANGDCMDVLCDNGAGEFYTPLSPKTSFNLTSFEAGVQTGVKGTIQIPAGINALQYIPGAVQRNACSVIQPLALTSYGQAMMDAVDDFDAMVNSASIFETL